MSLTKESANTQRSGFDTAITGIMDIINKLKLKPGDKLPTEREIGQQLHVSRTVVREAISALSMAGFINARQGSGLYLLKEPHPFATAAIQLPVVVDPTEVLNLFEFRLTVESEAAYFAANRMVPKMVKRLERACERNLEAAQSDDMHAFRESDVDFHTGIAKATGNPFFVSVIETCVNLKNRAVDFIFSSTPGSMLLAAQEHSVVLEAIRDGDSSKAMLTMKTHLETARDNYQEGVRQRLES